MMLFLISIIIFNLSIVYYRLSVESFSNNNQNKIIILLGDSILKNNSYVKNGNAVDDILRKNTTKRVYNYACDDTKISDVYEQLTNIDNIVVYNIVDNKNNINNINNSIIILSVGGNNIVEKYSMTGQITNNNISTIFDNYKILIDTIKEKMPESKLILLNLYHIQDVKYNKLNNSIDVWNDLLSNYVNNTSKIDGLLDINRVLNKPEDLIGIEPSEIGSKKIVDKIINYYSIN